jgi:gamma-glutamyl hercynylcysteine S-oxide synthase
MDTPSRKTQIAEELARVREKTLRLLASVPDRFWNVRVHDFYSPIGWHFGHVGMTEEHWTCARALGLPPRDARLCFLFANIPENPKDNRVHLPDRNEVTGYLCATRHAALAALARADLGSPDPLLANGYAWEFALQHECQHQETIAELLQLIRLQDRPAARPSAHPPGAAVPAPVSPRMVCVPGGEYTVGSDDPLGYDNEQPAHTVTNAPFALDACPVTAAEWLRFVDAGGYDAPALWCDDGWSWREEYDVCLPEYWRQTADGYAYCAADGVRPIDPAEPVSAISWYEADAYARWAGKRLPTEAEWEVAAAYDSATGRMRSYPWGDDPAGAERVDAELRAWRPAPIGEQGQRNALGLVGMAGGVWEWTASPFLPYPGFRAFPYDGYSLEHMDGRHFVCRGGSWATDRRILRSSFRNWYVPGYRQGFLGVRCAR